MTSRWTTLITFLSLLVCFSGINSQGNNELDVIFLLDSSSSIGPECFRQLLGAVVDYVNDLPVGPDAVHVGVVTFSTVWQVIYLTGNVTALRTEIPLLPYGGRDTNTFLALDQAQTMIMSSERPDVRKAVLLITDGVCRYPTECERAAEEVRNLGVPLWAIGVGENQRLLELVSYAGELRFVRTTDRCDLLPRVDLGLTAVTTPSPTPSSVSTKSPTPSPVTTKSPIPSSVSTKSPNPSPVTTKSPTPAPNTTKSPVSPDTTRSPQPGPSPGTDSRTGDDSVSFKESDGLCYMAVAKNGFGYAAHPQDCDKYIQCHAADDGTVTASIRLCPKGEFWEQEVLACVQIKVACCQDPCHSEWDGYTYSMNRGCGQYWQCEGGVSTAKHCKPGHAYVPSHGCVITPRCEYVDDCKISAKCTKKPVSESSSFNDVVVMNIDAETTCKDSKQFDISSCTCREMDDKIYDCPHIAYLNEGPGMTNISANGTTVCSALDGTCTSKKHDITVHPDSTRPLTMHFRYKASSNHRKGYAPEVLIRSKESTECNLNGGLFVVSDDSFSLNVRVISPHGYALDASVPLWGLEVSEWREVWIQYKDGDLSIRISVGNLVYTSFTKSGFHIQVGVCGWKVGEPGDLKQKVNLFTGNISEVFISRCYTNGT